MVFVATKLCNRKSMKSSQKHQPPNRLIGTLHCSVFPGGAWEEALGLLTDAWGKDLDPSVECYSHVIRALHSPAPKLAAQLLKELRHWGPAEVQENARFHSTPMLKWQREMKQYGCGVRNEIDWQGQGPVPKPKASGCWCLS